VFYELAFHFNPHCAEACNNLGVIYKDRDNLDKAVECYQVMTIVSVVSTLDGFIGLHRFLIAAFFLVLQLALSIKPNFSQSLNNLGVVYTVQVSIVRFLNFEVDQMSSVANLIIFSNFSRARWMLLQV